VPSEKATALVLRTSDWSETSKIATLWTREFGKVRVLAKGGRRLKSNFEVALDLLTLCTIVLVRKTSGSLDLLTEAQVVRRFPLLSTDLPALYAGYYVAELLADWTEDYDPHPRLFDEALETLGALGSRDVATGPRLMRFELVLLQELGYSPALDTCAACGREAPPGRVKRSVAFSPAAGGIVCQACSAKQRQRRTLSPQAWQALKEFNKDAEAWRKERSPAVRAEIRQVLGEYVTYALGRQPRLLPYLGS
jgi:DNA repair protein RecO (recombination protein O)